MLKEPYVKPEVKSEILEPEALCSAGSGGGFDWISGHNKASASVCCEEKMTFFRAC